MNDFLIRTTSGIILILLALLMAIKGGVVLSCFVFLLSIIGIREFYNALENIGIKPIKIVGYISCLYFFLHSLELIQLNLIFMIYLLLVLLLISSVFKKDMNLVDLATTFLGVFYIPFFMQHIIYLDGTIYIWLIFIAAWGTDTFAYIFGNLFGKNKLHPELSPNKTIEGSIGGIFGTFILTLIFSKYFALVPLKKLLILSITSSIMAQLGDLAASKIKRFTKIKDYGFIMPGHGGVLDRFDSILFTAPFVYYFINYFIL